MGEAENGSIPHPPTFLVFALPCALTSLFSTSPIHNPPAKVLATQATYILH